MDTVTVFVTVFDPRRDDEIFSDGETGATSHVAPADPAYGSWPSLAARPANETGASVAAHEHPREAIVKEKLKGDFRSCLRYAAGCASRTPHRYIFICYVCFVCVLVSCIYSAYIYIIGHMVRMGVSFHMSGWEAGVNV